MLGGHSGKKKKKKNMPIVKCPVQKLQHSHNARSKTNFLNFGTWHKTCLQFLLHSKDHKVQLITAARQRSLQLQLPHYKWTNKIRFEESMWQNTRTKDMFLVQEN